MDRRDGLAAPSFTSAFGKPISGTLPITSAGRSIRGVSRSTARRNSSAGPSVISRNSSDGGYLVVLRNDSTVVIVAA